VATVTLRASRVSSSITVSIVEASDGSACLERSRSIRCSLEHEAGAGWQRHCGGKATSGACGVGELQPFFSPDPLLDHRF
jgi:hypothetical protein